MQSVPMETFTPTKYEWTCFDFSKLNFNPDLRVEVDAVANYLQGKDVFLILSP